MKKFLLLTLSVMMGFTALFAQQKVTGTVTSSEDGAPMPYVTVVVAGTTISTQTNLDGMYSINVPTGNNMLRFSFVGMQTVNAELNGRAIVDIVMSPDAIALEDIVVVAFGTSTRESFTGAATVVSSEVLTKSQSSSVINALAGAVPGIQLTSSNGAPGASSTIRIRGFSSLSAGNDPLIIVDGAPYSGDLSNIATIDVESITVLKDASSNALYGARGANGVVMITTKKAKAGEALVTFDVKYGGNMRALQNYNTIQDPLLHYETHYGAMMNYFQNKLGLSLEDANVRANQNIGLSSSNAGLGYLIYEFPQGQSFIGTNGKVNPNATLGRTIGDYYITPDDWADEAYRTGVRQEYIMTVSGANEKASFYSSVAYLSNEGITAGSDLKRLTARLRGSYQAKSWMKVGGNMSYTNFNSNYLSNNGSSTSTGNVWAFTSQMAPIYPLWIRNADGTRKVDANGIEMMDYGDGQNAGLARPFLFNANALQDLRLNTRNNEGNAATGNGFVDINFYKDLKLTINGTFNLDETRNTEVLNPYYGQFASTKGTVGKSHSRSFDVNFQQLLNYNKTFGRNTISVLVGHEYFNTKSYYLYGSKSNMFSQKNKELGGAVVDGQSAYSSLSEYNQEGFFGRLQYDFADKLYFSGSYRRDASSRFNPSHRWGNFWSVGASWLMNKEPWFVADWVDELKIKASAGQQGNDNIGAYRYIDLYDITNSSGNVSTIFSSKGSENITWETTTNINTGIEFSLWKRLTGVFDYYHRITTDMLFSFPVAPSMGYTSYFANVGNMKNYGAELSLNFNAIKTNKVSWDININVTYLKNKITMLDEGKKTKTAYDANGNEYKGYQNGSFFVAEGVSHYSWYLKEYAGVGEDGQSLWYKDEKGADGERTGTRVTTNQYSEADYYINNATSISPFYGGFGTTLNAYGFDFSINFSYQLGGKQYDSGYASAMSSPTTNNSGYAYHVDVLKSWSKENTSSDIPRFQFDDTYSSSQSTRFLTDASYLNIENINLGYTLSNNIVKKLGGTSLRFYVSCENVWYWSKRQGFDPRISYTGTGSSYYSPMRTISGGITVKF